MKRRDFVIAMTTGVVGTSVPLLARAALCPPGTVKVQGGANATTTCPAVPSPSWYGPAASGQWLTLPNSALASSGVMESGWSAAQVAWSGAVLNTQGLYIGANFVPGTFLVVWGGGHVDSGLNAIYCYGPLESSSPQWYLPRPSTSPPPTNVEFDANGNPVARHVYDSISYLPDSNWMFAAGTLYRYIDSGGGADTPVYQFNVASPATNQPWTQEARMDSVNGGAAAAISVYDPVQKGVWAISGYNVMFYDPATNSWSINTNGGMTFNMSNAASALDTKRGIWAIFGNDSGQYLYFYATSEGVNGSGYVPTMTGTPPSTSGGVNGSIIYDAAADCFVCWYNSGAQLWTLTAPASNPYQGGNAWAWNAIAPQGGAAPSVECGLNTSLGEPGYPTGTYGRFAYVPNPAVQGYALMNRPNDPIYFYKP
jgi:hypothetical protein